MTDDELRAWFAITERDGVRFEPVFPPDHEIEPTTYFGGLPRLPAHIPWPEADVVVESDKRSARTESVASTFVGQIDLSQLPSCLTLDVPDSGTLFFFVDTAMEDLIFDGTPGNGGKVIYWDKSTSDVPIRPAPARLGPCFGREWSYHYKWLTHLGSDGFAPPKSFLRFAMRPTALRVHDLQYTGPRFQMTQAGEPDALRLRKQESNALLERVAQYQSTYVNRVLSDIRSASSEAAAPPPVERNYFVVSSGPEAVEARRAWRGGPGYPYAWVDVEIFCGLHLDHHNEYRQHVRTTPEHVHRDLIAIEAEVRRWLEHVKAAGRWSSVPDDMRARFLQWYGDIASRASDATTDPRHWVLLMRCLLEAYRTGPRMCLAHSAAAAKLVPDAWRENQRWQWATNLSGHGGRLIDHVLLGSRDDSPYRLERRSDVPLMTFDTQDCFSWMWGDVQSITFWVNYQDLAARDFSKAYVTLDSG